MGRRLAVAKAYCSSANLGPGFDIFGLSLNMYADTVKVEPTEKKSIVINMKGPYRDAVPLLPSKNSAGPPAMELLRRAQAKKGLKVTIKKNVPPGLGLGSSGATAAACTKAVDSLLETGLSDDEMVQVASLGEGAIAETPHMDNVAASLLGGFVIVYGRDPAHVVSIRPSSRLAVAIVTPRVQLPKAKTKIARSLVPDRVELSKAVLSIGWASALAVGFARGDIGLIGEGMNDEIVEPHRERLVPGYRSVKRAALSAGAAGVAISGAGPSIIAVVDRAQSDARRVAKTMAREFARNNVQAQYFITGPSLGARIVRSA